MQRIIGFLYIVRGLTPLILILTTILVVQSFKADWKVEIKPSIDTIESQIDTLRDTYNNAQQQLASESVEKAATPEEQTTTVLGNILFVSLRVVLFLIILNLIITMVFDLRKGYRFVLQSE